jgi:hypothetical protein
VRVTSSLWVSALVRRYYTEGAIATVARRGAEEAGAIFITMDRLNGLADLYGPAPQASFEESHPSDRLFQRLIESESFGSVSARLEKETRFDPDLWIVAIEDREGRAFFDAI